MREFPGEIMDAARFRRLCDAYGGRIDRWPDAVQADAALFAETTEGRRLISAACKLDAMLDRYRVVRPARQLEARIIARAQAPRGLLALLRSRWAGLGLVGVGLAGAATGALAMTLVLTAPLREDGLQSDRIATVFGDIGDNRSDQGETTQ
jgi:hypothetical protein